MLVRDVCVSDIMMVLVTLQPLIIKTVITFNDNGRGNYDVIDNDNDDSEGE